MATILGKLPFGGGKLITPDSTSAKLKWQVSVKGSFFNTAKVRRSMDEMTFRCLYNAGYAVKQAAKKGVGNKEPKIFKRDRAAMAKASVIEYDGGLYQDISRMSTGRPRAPGKPIKSWGPKRFMYYDIMDFMSRGMFGPTVVIGPYKAAWLARLHEFGGTLGMTAYRLGEGAARNAWLRREARKEVGRDSKGRFTRGKNVGPQANQLRYGAIVWAARRPKGKSWKPTNLFRIARYPARPFMQGAAGVQKAAAKANEKFRNALRKAG